MDQLPSLSNQPVAPIAPVEAVPVVAAEIKRGRGRPRKSETPCTVATGKLVGKCEANALADQIGADYLQTVVDNDAVLRLIVETQRGVPTLAQIAYFGKQGWNVSLGSRYSPDRSVPSLQREIGRMERVITRLQIAGTEQDRFEMGTEVQRATAELDARGAELAETIAKAEAELRRLERAKAQSEKRLAEAVEAVGHLRDDAPPAMVKLAAQSRDAVRETIGADFRELDARRTSLIALQGLDIDSDSAKHVMRRMDAHHPIRQACDRQSWVRAWEAQKAAWLTELVALDPDWQDAKTRFDDAIAAAGEYENFYVR